MANKFADEESTKKFSSLSIRREFVEYLLTNSSPCVDGPLRRKESEVCLENFLYSESGWRHQQWDFWHGCHKTTKAKPSRLKIFSQKPKSTLWNNPRLYRLLCQTWLTARAGRRILVHTLPVDAHRCRAGEFLHIQFVIFEVTITF